MTALPASDRPFDVIVYGAASFVGRILASFLPAGEVASLAYAFRIFILPFSLFAVPTYTVLFSKLSRLFHEEDWKGINAHVDSSLVLVCITLIPSTIFLCVSGDVADTGPLREAQRQLGIRE